MGEVPVYLNVYDLSDGINDCFYWFGFGFYHSGVQVHGVEYAFCKRDDGKTGVTKMQPKKCPEFIYRKSILVGSTDLDAKKVDTLIKKLSKEYLGNTYNLLRRNCNHFSNDLCKRLTSKTIPCWINILARFSLLCKCVLPTPFKEEARAKVSSVRAESKISDVDEEKLKSQSSKTKSSTTTTTTTTTATTTTTTSSVCSTTPASRSRKQRRCLPPPTT